MFITTKQARLLALHFSFALGCSYESACGFKVKWNILFWECVSLRNLWTEWRRARTAKYHVSVSCSLRLDPQGHAVSQVNPSAPGSCCPLSGSKWQDTALKKSPPLLTDDSQLQTPWILQGEEKVRLSKLRKRNKNYKFHEPARELVTLVGPIVTPRGSF